jgi:hypothetical protein
MDVDLKLPCAFSVHDENEFYAFQHLMARMHPHLRVAQVTTGKHVNGSCTVFWGLVHFGDDNIPKEDVESALEDAGYDFERNGPVDELDIPKLDHAMSNNESAPSAATQRGDGLDQACFADG